MSQLIVPGVAPPPVPVTAVTAATAIGIVPVAAVANGTAVEVTSALGDSVVGVEHVTDPHGGRVSRTTWALLGGGAALLLIAALTFTIAVAWADRDADRRVEWTEKLGRPAHAFRPHLVAPIMDWMALGGLGLGLATIAVGLWRRRGELRSPVVRIGSAPGVAFATADAPSADFPLVAPLGDGFVVHLAPSMTGDLQLGGRAVAVADVLAAPGLAGAMAAPAAGVGAIAVPVSAATRMRLRCGATTFHVAAVAAPRPQATPLVAGIDRRVATYLVASAAAHLLLLAVLRTIPPGTETAAADLASTEDLSIHAVAIGAQETPPPPPEAGAASSTGGQHDLKTSATPMTEGATGTEVAIADPGTRKIAQRTAEPSRARAEAIEAAREAGVLAAFRGDTGHVFDSLTGESDLTSGFDDMDLVGGSMGDGPGSPVGFGDGRKGFGPGGGGKDWNSVTAGDYDTIRGGKGTGDDFRFPGDGPPGNGRPHTKRVIVIVPRPPVPDGIDKETLRRYIRRHLSKVSYCYEKELLVKPGIGGTIEANFVVNGGGVVIESRANGFDDEVAQCIAGVVKNIQFPKLADVGIFKIKYPFTMHPSGS